MIGTAKQAEITIFLSGYIVNISFPDVLGSRVCPTIGKLIKKKAAGETGCGNIADPGCHKETVFEPSVLYRPAANTLAWIDGTFPKGEKKRLEFLNAIASGRTSATVTGDAVFEKFRENVLAQSSRTVPF